MELFDYHCCCGYDFFFEEGYEPKTDKIVCPCCGNVIEEN